MAKKKEESKKAKPAAKKSEKPSKAKKAIVPASMPVLVPAAAAPAEPVEPAPVTESVKPVTKLRKAAAAAPKKSPARPKAKPAAEVVISNDDIALRAYFIAEARQRNGHWGDPSGDWIEAERQLREEARKSRK